MSPEQHAYLAHLRQKRDEYLLARDQEHIVPERLPCLMGYASVYEVQVFIENLHGKYAHEWRTA